MTITTERTARKGFTLRDAGREFWKHPSPWMIGATLVAALAARVVVGDWQITDALVPVAMLALFPFFEWAVHVFILHWRPKTVGGLTIDPLLARDHRAPSRRPSQHSADLHTVEGSALGDAARRCRCAACVSAVRPRSDWLVFITVLGLGYEWTPLPDPQRLQAENRCLPGDLAQSPPTSLQERALLVHRHQLRHRRPGVGHLPRSRHGRDLADCKELARHRGLAGYGRTGVARQQTVHIQVRG